MHCWNGSRRATTTDQGISFSRLIATKERSHWTWLLSSSGRASQSRQHWRRLAHVSAYGRDDAGRDGRTSTHDPRLFALQQSPRDEQISSSNTGKQSSRARKTGGCDLAEWLAVGEQINSDSVVGAGACVLGLVRGKAQRVECFEGLLDPNGPRFFSGSAISV